MKREFRNDQRHVIDSGGPNVVESSIEVSGLTGGLRDVDVTLEVDHTWTADLRISLIGPGGKSVLLVSGAGGSGDHFRETRFDDEALETLRGASAPFRGTFRPAEPLSRFDDGPSNGTWTLRIEDTAFRDGGALIGWSLEIESGGHSFENRTPVAIDPGEPNTVESHIQVHGLPGLVVSKLRVSVDVEHTWDADLRLIAVAPDGTEVLLVSRAGGRGDNFRNTVFSDDAPGSITSGTAPFTGRFRPEEALAAFAQREVEGTWTLRVEDTALRDGGQILGWALQLETCCAHPPADSEFSIDVRFVGGLSSTQRAVFQLAAARWARVIVGDLPAVVVDREEIDDLLILAQGERIDGPSGILGQAGPTHLRSGSLLPAKGIMSFDIDDLARMEADGSLVDVIVHEMGHVLGLGTLWRDLRLLAGSGTNDPTFTGTNAVREYTALTRESTPQRVPVANTGGAGTREGHWRESVFANELMTGFLDPGQNPLSRVTIASLEDLGYVVEYDMADAYALPQTGLRAMAVMAHCCGTVAPRHIILSSSAVVGHAGARR